MRVCRDEEAPEDVGPVGVGRGSGAAARVAAGGGGAVAVDVGELPVGVSKVVFRAGVSHLVDRAGIAKLLTNLAGWILNSFAE